MRLYEVGGIAFEPLEINRRKVNPGLIELIVFGFKNRLHLQKLLPALNHDSVITPISYCAGVIQAHKPDDDKKVKSLFASIVSRNDFRKSELPKSRNANP